MKAPVFTGQLELTSPLADFSVPDRTAESGYTEALLIVRVQHSPVGYLRLPAEPLSAAQLGERIWAELGPSVNALRQRAGLPPLRELPGGGIPSEESLAFETADCPLVSVVVCTRDRPESLLRTLSDLARLNCSAFEVVVVDNAPGSDSTRRVFDEEFGHDQRFRYVREDRPGLSRARNRGVAEASAEIIAFTDDDVRVDPWWLDGIVRGFSAAPRVACVTGLIATAEIENPAQLYFHLRAKWGESCEPRLFDLTENRDDSPLYPYTAGRFGAGANFALTRVALKDVGMFDEALGAGTPSGGGEDLNMFMRLVLNGHRIAYEPSAIVWHVHRSELADLGRQVRSYGTGLTAAMAAILLQHPKARRELPLRVFQGMAHMLKLTNGVREEDGLPRELVAREFAAFALGPVLYLKGKRRPR